MKSFIACVVFSLLLYAPLAFAGVSIRQEQIQFNKGKTTAAITGKIKGYQIVDYQVRANKGQLLIVHLSSKNTSTYFNILPPGSDEAIFIGSTSGNRFEAGLPDDGLYKIRVYLMRNAARRNVTAHYTLKVKLKDGMTNTTFPPSAATGLAFDKTLELLGMRFHVTSANNGSLNILRILPSGLEVDNSAIEKSIDGTVTGVEVADLNADGSPEIYIYITSAGSGSYGSLVAYSANQRKSLSEIYLPVVTQNPTIAEGYRGHDQFAVLEGVLGQRFPIYRDSDINAKPTGGTRQVQYKLVSGENGWLLKVDRVVEY